jgi:hypothetical protein
MTIESIKELAHRDPFRPFAIVLDSGTEIIIKADTELLFPRNRPETIYVFASNGYGWIFEAQAVTALNDNGSQA